MKFTITTDTSCDVFRVELDRLCIPYIPLTYSIDGETYKDDFSSDNEYSSFYTTLKSGKLPTTSQINAFLHEEFFDSILEKTQGDIVHLSLSSGLSATYNSACMGAENSMKKFPDRKIYVIDTLSATQGHRYLLDEARIMRDEDKSAKETAETLNLVKHNIHHWLLVSDLMHLRRGGRVSSVSAYIGTVLNIKPVISVDDQGKLSVIHKSKGTKQALKYLMQMMEQHGDKIDGGRVYIASGNSGELAEELREMILSTYKCEVIIGWIGPIIGAHTGGGSLGLVYRSKGRIPHKA